MARVKNKDFCFVSVCTEKYLDWMKVLLYSMNAHCGYADSDYFIVTSKETLSDKLRDELKLFWKNLKFIDVDYDLVNGAAECFNIKGYNKIIKLDADMINWPGKDFKELIDLDIKFGMVYDYAIAEYNKGIIVIDKSLVNKKNYDNCLKGDLPKVIDEIPKKFNTLNNGIFNENMVTLLHYKDKTKEDKFLKMWKEHKNATDRITKFGK